MLSHTFQLPHIGVFLLIFAWTMDGFVSHSLIVTHFADLPLIFKDNNNFNDDIRHIFSFLQIEGLWNLGYQE